MGNADTQVLSSEKGTGRVCLVANSVVRRRKVGSGLAESTSPVLASPCALQGADPSHLTITQLCDSFCCTFFDCFLKAYDPEHNINQCLGIQSVGANARLSGNLLSWRQEGQAGKPIPTCRAL